MKQNNIADSITARCVAGHATELAVWRFVRDISVQLATLHKDGKSHGSVSLENVVIEGKRYVLSNSICNGSAADDVWNLGSCIYELITGNLPFGGKGKAGQAETSPLPVFSESRASRTLSSLTAKCLSFKESERIQVEEIVVISNKEVQRLEQYTSDMDNLKFKKPQNRVIRMKTYDFWPETMMGILLFILLALPQQVFAQNDAELKKLIRLTTTMRDQSKRAEVLRELKDDDKWTLMDELKMDQNECSYSDKVNMFGINDIATEIAQREKGIVNVGGRFKHSADGKHHYSFIELTAKAGKTISYNVKDHKGTQTVVVVPFDKKCKYSAVCISDGKELKAHSVEDGVSYFTVSVGKRGNYEFEISNESTKNASFAVITYNPMK